MATESPKRLPYFAPGKGVTQTWSIDFLTGTGTFDLIPSFCTKLSMISAKVSGSPISDPQ